MPDSYSVHKELTMKTMRLVLLALLLAMAGTTAYARDSFSLSIGLGYPAYYAPPPAVYYAPPPVVYYQPAPAYYYGPWISYRYDEPRYRHQHRHWRSHDRHDRHNRHDRHDRRWDRR
jgi:hypothetical protein